MKTEQKLKRKYGDWQLLGDMLDISSDAAKMRYLRGNKEAQEAMKRIKENRESLIAEFKEKQ